MQTSSPILPLDCCYLPCIWIHLKIPLSNQQRLFNLTCVSRGHQSGTWAWGVHHPQPQVLAPCTVNRGKAPQQSCDWRPRSWSLQGLNFCRCRMFMCMQNTAGRADAIERRGRHRMASCCSGGRILRRLGIHSSSKSTARLWYCSARRCCCTSSATHDSILSQAVGPSKPE